MTPFIPITTRQQMVRLLEDLRLGRIATMDALARIEAWGDDFARRNVESWRTRQKPADATIDDGPRRGGPNIS